MDGRLNSRRQGDLGELSALGWLVEQGYCVCLPVLHSPDYDMIATRGREVLRVQVKTATHRRRDRFEVLIATRGGNQSWSGVAKRFSPDRCDRLFVLCGDGRRWFIPADVVEGSTQLRLGGPKYAAYEVEPGRPLPTAEAA